MASLYKTRPPRQRTFTNDRLKWDQGNVESAILILADDRKFPPGSLAQLWAERFLKSRAPLTPTPTAQGLLFGGDR